jgi:hypothetical protein
VGRASRVVPYSVPIPRDFLQDNTGDWDLSKGLVRTSATDIQQFVRQKITEVTQVFLGEYFLNLRIGVPIFRDVWGQRFDHKLVSTLYRRVLLKAQGVSDVVQLSLAFDSRTRNLSITGKVRTVAGTVVPFSELILE